MIVHQIPGMLVGRVAGEGSEGCPRQLRHSLANLLCEYLKHESVLSGNRGIRAQSLKGCIVTTFSSREAVFAEREYARPFLRVRK